MVRCWGINGVRPEWYCANCTDITAGWVHDPKNPNPNNKSLYLGDDMASRRSSKVNKRVLTRLKCDGPKQQPSADGERNSRDTGGVRQELRSLPTVAARGSAGRGRGRGRGHRGRGRGRGRGHGENKRAREGDSIGDPRALKLPDRFGPEDGSVRDQATGQSRNQSYTPVSGAAKRSNSTELRGATKQQKLVEDSDGDGDGAAGDIPSLTIPTQLTLDVREIEQAGFPFLRDECPAPTLDGLGAQLAVAEALLTQIPKSTQTRFVYSAANICVQSALDSLGLAGMDSLDLTELADFRRAVLHDRAAVMECIESVRAQWHVRNGSDLATEIYWLELRQRWEMDERSEVLIATRGRKLVRV